MTAVALPPYESIKVTRDAGVGVVTIDRPPRNALVPTTMLEIRDAVYRLDEDPQVRAIVLTGAGRYFCSGADLTRSGMLVDGKVDRKEMLRMREAHRRKLGLKSGDLPQLRVPVIAAINGPAAGGGLSMALAADIRLIAEDAKLNVAFVQRGLGPEHGLSWLLPRLVGHSAALELLLTGRTVDGVEATRLGLASRALPAAEVLPAAMDMARGIAERCSPMAVALTKRLAWAHAGDASLADAMRHEKVGVEWITQQPDTSEGIRAYMEKRAPAWKTTGREPLPSPLAALLGSEIEEF
jgi:enoyl-CoA hydratase/carnithine racemase